MYDAEHNQYYEVKHAPQYQSFLNSDQKKKYDSGIIVGKLFIGYSFSESPTPGTRKDISGSFQYQYWDVTYKSHGDGVITYEWKLNEHRYNQHVGTVATVAAAAAAGMAHGNMSVNNKVQFSRENYRCW